MKTRVGLSVLVAWSVLWLSGCASVMTGTTQKLTFNSNPAGATVKFDGRTVGTTPVSIDVKKENKRPSVSFSKEGYQTLDLKADRALTPWFWGNVLIGGFLGSTTDNLTGAAYEYSPGKYWVTLKPGGTTALDAASGKTPAQKVREFIVVNHTQIKEDVAKGGGDYLASLTNLLSVPEADRAGAAKTIRNLSEVYSDPAELATRVVAIYYPDDAATSTSQAAAPSPIPSTSGSPAAKSGTEPQKPDPDSAESGIETPRKTQLTGEIEYFRPGGIDEIGDRMNPYADFLTEIGIEHSVSKTASSAVGFKVGVERRLTPRLNGYLSLGYIIGPTIKADLDDRDISFPGTVHEKFETGYLRLLLGGRASLPIDPKFGLFLGAGAGVAQAHATLNYTGTGYYGGTDYTNSNRATGFTYEVSPGLYLKLNRLYWEFGVQFVHLPTVKINIDSARDIAAFNSDAPYEIEWDTWGFFTALRF